MSGESTRRVPPIARLAAMGTRSKALGLVTLALLVFACVGSASANDVTYSGRGTETKRVIVSFVLRGKACPRGPRCFKGAKVRGFGAAPFGWPNCSFLLESTFDFGPPGGAPKAVRVNRRRRFRGSGGNIDDDSDKVTFRGRFSRNGAVARGWFKVVREGICTTGRVYWKTTPQR